MTDKTGAGGLQSERLRWEHDALSRHRQKNPERKSTFPTSDGTETEAIYLPRSDSDLDVYLASLGFPGEFPFTRGVQPNMYRGRLWTMRQYAGFGTAAESNERYRYLLTRGTTGLSVAFDLPTQMGLDSDDQRAAGEVGKVGVAIDSLEDMLVLFDGIPLDVVSTSMTINSTAAILLCLYRAVGEIQGVAPEKLRGTIQNDLLKEYIARGTYIYPPQPSLRIITDIFQYCAQELPNFNTISISGYHIREAGSDAVQEVAFTLANGIAYVNAALDKGLDVDEFAGRVAFFFNAHNRLLEEVAKFRAARRMWAHIMRDRFKAKDPRSWMLRFHTQTAGCTLTAQSPDNNVVRVAIQALAAVLGGTQSLHTNSRDEALALPTESSARLALRTQQIIAHESGVADFVDALGGSYVVEALTDHIAARASAYIEKIDGMGGMVRAIELGFPQREVQETAWRYQRAVETGDEVVVGVNAFVDPNEEPADILKVDPALEREQIERVRSLRERRDATAANNALLMVQRAAIDGGNVLPPILDAVRAYCTVGEISGTLERIFGRYNENIVI
ncbi:MAG: methylmalonyl-CoA mutase family protein [Myxococcales bacterium]|nr:methylmalonyl-CoA mutase family protein [Myxococcales bacterium]